MKTLKVEKTGCWGMIDGVAEQAEQAEQAESASKSKKAK